jgi:hypothetical protein
MTEQSEWATDYVFGSPHDLAAWYPRWLRHGVEARSCKDVLRYLGKQVPAAGYGRCTGEAQIDLRTRPDGTRLKFWYHTNALKFYDKEGVALRVETTINDPSGYRVYRAKEGGPAGAPKSWQQLRKGVADLPRRAEVSEAANRLLAESLAGVAEPDTLGTLLAPLGQPVVKEGRRLARALNPLTGTDGALLRALAQGEFLVNGFRNRDVRAALYGSAAGAEGTAAAVGPGDAAAGAGAGPRPDRAGSQDAPLPPDGRGVPRVHGAAGGAGDQREPPDRRRFEFPRARRGNRGDTNGAERSKRRQRPAAYSAALRARLGQLP